MNQKEKHVLADEAENLALDIKDQLILWEEYIKTFLKTNQQK